MKFFFLWWLLLFSYSRTTGQNSNGASLKRQLATAKEDTARVNALLDLGSSYTFNYPDTAFSYGTQGLQLSEKIGYKTGEAYSLSILCLSSTFLGNYTSALGFGLKALPILEKLHDTTMLVWTNIQIVTCYMKLEDYDQAMVYGYNAKRLFRFTHPDVNQISVGLAMLGSVYERKDQLDSALSYEQKALAWDKSWSGAFKNMGEIYAKKRQQDSALYYYKQGLSIAITENGSVGLVDLYNDLSKLFESKGDVDSAVHYANKSVRQPGVQVNPEGLLQAATQLARLYEKEQTTDSTIKYLKLTNTLKDSLYSRKKTREAQSFAFNEQLHQQELAAQHQRDENKIRVAVLLGMILIFLSIAFFLWRNIRQKQKANYLLQQEKEKVESTFSELKSTQQQLIQSEKMASLGELTAGIAHEIQNPLNFVNNFSETNTELIAEVKEELKAGNQDEALSILDDIKGNEEKINLHGRRADSIVKGMLEHSRASTGTREPTDLNKLVDEYLRLAYHGFRAKDKDCNATIETHFDETISKINIVPQEVGRVLLNLYNNAFYTVNERRKSIADGYEPTIVVRTKRQNDKIEISVQDNGNGIPQNIINKIFQPFFTTKPTGQGTGLGLSLSYDIIKAHGGQLKVESKEGVGSVFKLLLSTHP